MYIDTISIVYIYIYNNNRRKFRSQTSDNMDRWKAEMGRVREKRRVEKTRSEKRKSQKKEDADARKGRNVVKHCVFPMICGSGGSKSRLAKAAGAEPSGQMRDEKLWREAHFEVNMYKTHQLRTTFGSWDVAKVHAVVARSTFEVKMYKAPHVRATFGGSDVEKVHAVVARSTFRSQHVQNTPGSDHFWKLRCRKSAHRCGAKHISKWKCTKHHMFAPLLEVEMSKKCIPLWREAHFEVKMYKTHHARTTFGRSELVSRGRRKGLCTLSKASKTLGFCSISKNDCRRGTCEEDLQRCISCGRRSTKNMFIRDVRRSGRWFPERGCILEHQIFRFAEMILRDRCSTAYDLASLFRGRRSTLDRWSGKIARRIGTRPSALHSTFYFWRKSRRIAWFLMLSSSKIEEVTQNCFIFDVVKFKKWSSHAELLRFWCCQVQKMKKSRRIASFLMLSTLKNEEVTRNCCVFDVINFEKWRSLAE